MALKNTQLDTTETIIVEAVTKQMAVLSLMFCNTDTANNQTITIYAYPSTSSAGNGTMIIYEFVIAPRDTYLWTADEKFILAIGDKITGTASLAATITVTVNYMEI